MRRQVLASVLAVSTAAFGACSGAPAVNNTPVKPISSPAPVATVSPVASPVVSPTVDPKASPVKPGTTPEVKKSEKSDDKAKEVKPAAIETPKK